MSAAAATVRRRLAALPGRIAVVAPAPTADVLRGAERLLLAPARAGLRAEYASLFAAGGCDAVATGADVSVSFLARGGLFEDMDRDNDLSYYVVGRGKRGKTTEGDDFAWETSKSGHRHCIPRALVSEGEKVAFAALLMELACAELAAAAAAAAPGDATTAPLTGASVHLGAALRANATTLEACLENQLRSAGAPGAVDCLLVAGADTAEDVAAVREALRRHARRRVRRSVPGLTGVYVAEEEETEVGFDVPAVVLREGEIHEIL